MKNKIIGIFIVLLLLLAFNIVPSIQGNEVCKIIQNTKNIEMNKFDIIEFMENMNEQDSYINENMLLELEQYLKNNNLQYSPILFECFLNNIHKKLGENEYEYFITFFYCLLQYANNKDITLQNIYKPFHKNLNNIQFNINSIIKGVITEQEFLNSIDDLLKINNIVSSNVNLQDSFFDAYWEKYGLAKCYWDGYMPSINNPEPSNRNVYNRLGLWRGDNYYQWSENAARYILGTQDTPQAPFYALNFAAVFISFIIIIIGLPIFLMGLLFSDGNNSIGKLTFGGGLAMIGIIIISLLLWYDWTVLNYFLFGTNAYLECQRTGNVDFIVHIVNETNCDINTYCSVVARSIYAFEKDGEPVYENFYDVNWSTNEFEYTLVKIANQNEDKSIYSLHSAQESPEKWKKAVPPPGLWSFTINANGYKEKIYTIEENIKPGECFNITIKLEKL